jgi:capsular exopolysaccharide synthesis family protein
VDTVRERLSLVVACFVAGIVIPIVYVILASPVYEAQANLLITPVPTDNETLVGLGVLRETNDPQREVDTVTQLVTTSQVAEAAAENLPDDPDPDELRDHVEANPVGQSNIIAITASADSPEGARDLANAFAQAAVDQRTENLHNRVDAVLPTLQARLEALPPDSAAAEGLATEIAQLETLAVGPDPTMSLETPASLPDSPSSPKKMLLIASGGALGLLVGILLAFGARLLDPRLRREEQLGQIFRLPVLARIPRERRSGRPLPRERLSAAGIEAYRTLRATLAASELETGSKSILVTGPSAGGGKTTTAINLAAALAAAGSSVILIEADVRLPSIAKALDLEPDSGLVSVLVGESTIEEALTVSPERYGTNLGLLLADVSGPSIAELISLPVMRKVIDDARELADYVVVDSPPLTEVIDALPLAKHVDQVLLVVRLNQSELRQIKELGEMLAGVGVTPTGVAVIGVSRRHQYYYAYESDTYGDGEGARRPAQRRARLFRARAADDRERETERPRV